MERPGNAGPPGRDRHPIIGVNRGFSGGMGGLPVRSRTTPVEIGGHTVEPLRPLPSNQKYERSQSGFVYRPAQGYGERRREPWAVTCTRPGPMCARYRARGQVYTPAPAPQYTHIPAPPPVEQNSEKPGENNGAPNPGTEPGKNGGSPPMGGSARVAITGLGNRMRGPMRVRRIPGVGRLFIPGTERRTPADSRMRVRRRATAIPAALSAGSPAAVSSGGASNARPSGGTLVVAHHVAAAVGVAHLHLMAAAVVHLHPTAPSKCSCE